MIDWKERRSLWRGSAWEGRVDGKLAFHLLPLCKPKGAYELLTTLSPGRPTRVYRGPQTGMKAARLFLRKREQTNG